MIVVEEAQFGSNCAPVMLTGSWAVPKIDQVGLGEIVRAFLADTERRGLALKTRRKYRNTTQLLEATKLEGRAVMEVRAHNMTRGWAYKLHAQWSRERGLVSAAELMKLLSAAWNHASRVDMVTGASPFRGLRKQAPPAKIKFAPDHIQRMRRFVEDAREEGVFSGLVADIVQVASATGARPGEVYSLEWASITDETIILSGKMGARAIPRALLSEEAEAVLEHRRGNGSRWVFPGRGRGDGHVGESVVSRKWAGFLAYCGERGLSMKTIAGQPLGFRQSTRHALSTLGAAQLGMPMHLVAALLGHSVSTAERHYAQLNVGHLVESAQKIKAATTVKNKNEGSAGLRRDRLRSAVERLGGEAKVAEMLEREGGVSKRAVYSWTTDKASSRREMPHEFVGQLARLGGVSVGHFYGEGPDQ